MQTPSQILQEENAAKAPPPTGRVAVIMARLDQIPARLIALGITLLMSIFLFILLGRAWFFFDDLEFLQDAHEGGLSIGTLLQPIAGHILPMTRALTWVVLLPGEPSWTIARVIIVILFLGACGSLWWMLEVCFGKQRLNLIPFILFATSATVALWAAWWASAIQELFLSMALFNAVGWGVRYLRDRRIPALVITYAWWFLGMLAFEKSMVILVLLPLIAMAYFASGSLWHRVRHLWGHYRIAVVTTFLLGFAMSAFYVWYVPETGDAAFKKSLLGPLFDVMLGKTLWPMLVGGPLKWSNNLGTVVPAPPALYFNLTLLTVVLTFLYLAGRRHRVGRSIVLVGVAFVFAYSLLLATRAVSVGDFAGYLYRYQGEVFLAALLALALSLMALQGAVEPSEPRTEPLVGFGIKQEMVVAGLTLIVVASLISSITYFNSWKVFPQRAQTYLSNLEKGVRAEPTAIIAGGRVPEDMLWAVHGKYTKIENVIAPFGIPAKFDKPTTQLHVVDDQGRLKPARVEKSGQTKEGPNPECSWKVSFDHPVSLPMEKRMIPWTWWARVGYMTGFKTQIRVTAGSSEFQTELDSGIGDLYFPTDGDFDAIEVEVLTPSSTVCLDRVIIGKAVKQGKEPQGSS